MSYTTDAQFYNPSVKIGSVSFFTSSDMQQFHHLLGCHTIGINSSFFFFKCFTFFKFNMPSQNSDKKVVRTKEKIKTICLTKKLF